MKLKRFAVVVLLMLSANITLIHAQDEIFPFTFYVQPDTTLPGSILYLDMEGTTQMLELPAEIAAQVDVSGGLQSVRLS